MQNSLTPITLNWQNAASLILLNALVIGVFFAGNYQRDWSISADQELTLAYNALLINSGYIQEFFDHPGFLTIQSLAILIKFLNFLNFISIDTIEKLNEAPKIFSAFNEITTAAHYLALINCLAVINVSFFLINHKVKSLIASLGLIAALFFSSSINFHFLYLRTELLTFSIFLMAIFCFSKIDSPQKSKQWIFMLSACLLLFYSEVNKSQILLYLPIYLYWALLLTQPEKVSQTPTSRISKAFAFVACIVNISFFVYLAQGTSKLFQLIYLIILNALIFFMPKRYLDNFNAIGLLNASYLTGYLFCATTVLLLGGNISLFFNTINNPLSMLKWATLNQLGQENSAIELVGVINKISSPMYNLLDRVDSQLVLFFANFILFYLLRKKLSKTSIQFILTSIALFYICSIISSSRYWAPNYFLFSEFFLFTNIVFLISKISNNIYKKLAAVSIALVVIMVNFGNFYNALTTLDNRRHDICSSTYISDWQHQINHAKVNEECKPYLNESKLKK